MRLNMQPQRILIVRLSAIGDVIQTMPVACALRERFPDATLVWAVEQRAGALLQGHEALDELILLPRGWLKSLGEVRRLRRRLREFNFDATVDVQSLTKSAVLAWLSGARRRIGFGNPGGRELSKWLNNERVDPKSTHVIDRYLELLGPLGIQRPTVSFQVPESQADRLTAERIIGEHSLDEGYAIVNPGAGWPSKLWPTERFAAVARHLGASLRLPTLVVWAGAAERGAAERIVAEGGRLAVLSPPTSLPELAALARRAKLFIGSDTGPLHLAAAVDTPCVGLYGPWPAARHGPYGPRHIALQKMFFEGPTRARRTAPPIYMESITTEMVCEACDEILNRDY
ncbi:MAG: glycosyltransferase family 9 protein [Pirellulaceae bacterium]|nr:glycosyltransferase family 9 protein [Pirellulaceae bacterium]